MASESSKHGNPGGESDARKWFVRFRPEPSAALRLFCFPYAGVGASAYFPWAREIPRGIELVGIQLPGRESRIQEEPFGKLSCITDELVEHLHPHLDRPYALFGHSMGALIGFEVARRLRQEGAPAPERLFVSARRAPTIQEALPKIHKLPDDEFIREIRKRWGGIPDAVLREADLLQLLLPALRADVTVLETHIHTEGEPLDCPISAFGGTEDANLSHEDLHAWREHTRRDFRLRMFHGDHFFLRSQQRMILQALEQDLLPALDGGKGPARC